MCALQRVAGCNPFRLARCLIDREANLIGLNLDGEELLSDRTPGMGQTETFRSGIAPTHRGAG